MMKKSRLLTEHGEKMALMLGIRPATPVPCHPDPEMRKLLRHAWWRDMTLDEYLAMKRGPHSEHRPRK